MSRLLPVSTNTRAYLLLLATTLCWGLNAVLAKLAVGEVSPMALVTLRWLCVVACLTLIARDQLRRDWYALRPRIGYVAAMAVLGFTSFNALYYLGGHYTSAVNIGILQGSVPVFVLLGVLAAYQVRATALQILGVIVTMVGVVVIGSGGSLERLTSLSFNPGDLLIIAACLLYAGYAVALRNRPASSALGLFTVLAGVAFASSLPLLAAEAMLGYLQWPTAKGWVVIGLAALFPSMVSQLCFIAGLALIGPSRASVFVNLVPVFAAIMAVAFLGEPFHVYHASALALVLGGIWISERGKAAAER